MFCGTGRLSKADVLAIRAEYAAGVPLAEIAAKYPVALGTVYPIVSGYAYRHVEGAIPGGLRSPRKLDRQKAAEIRSRANAGERHNDLAKEFGVKANLISRISTGVRWRDA